MLAILAFITTFTPYSMEAARADPSSCASKLTGLVNDMTVFNVIVVSRDGSADPSMPSGVSAITWSLDDYYCVFPEVDGRQQSNQAPATLLEPDVYKELYLNGQDEEYVPTFVDDSSIEMEDICIEECISEAEQLSLTTIPGLGSGPRLRSNTDHLEIRVHIPTAAGDPQTPDDGCNSKPTLTAIQKLETEFSITIKYWCYMVMNLGDIPPWDTTKASGREDDTTDGPTTDIFRLFWRLETYVETHWGSEHRAQVNQLVTAWVREASSNGIGHQNGFFSLSAESAIRKPDAPHASILLHELGHNFAADHFPADDWRRFTCGAYHRHWWGWHYHSHQSLMNYCHMMYGNMDYDSNNRDIVEANIKDF